MIRRCSARQLFIAAALAVFVIGGFTVSLRGFTTVGHAWGTNQVYYYVNTQSATNSSPSAIIDAVQRGAAPWSTQTNANIQLVYDGTTSGGAVLTWNWKAPNAKKFKVEFTGFVPSSPIPTYPYPLAINCPGTQNTCVSGPIVTNSTKGVAYYKVTTEAPVQVFNGRIIIDR